MTWVPSFPYAGWFGSRLRRLISRKLRQRRNV